MNAETDKVERVIGFDSHPDTFTAAILRGLTPAAAIVEKMFNKVPMGQLRAWARKHTTERDLIVLEASGNSFHVVRVLAKINRKALVLESAHMGKLKENHANNDKISAVRIGKAYLAGTARIVWVPDPKTQERRDLLHIHRKALIAPHNCATVCDLISAITVCAWVKASALRKPLRRKRSAKHTIGCRVSGRSSRES